nr:two-component response regulator-like PRR37 isoform X1 [Tanacetum cinerariifolium]
MHKRIILLDGSDNGSGIQSSWSRRVVEVETAKHSWDQLAGPSQSTCAQVIHARPDKVNTIEYNAGEDDNTDGIALGKIWKLESLEIQTNSGSPALELSLKRARDLKDTDMSTHRRNVVRQSDLSAFLRSLCGDGCISCRLCPLKVMKQLILLLELLLLEGSSILMGMRLLPLIKPMWNVTIAIRGATLQDNVEHQDNRNRKSTRRNVLVKTTNSTTLVSCDGLGGYDWSDQVEEGPNYALMAYSTSRFDFEIIKKLIEDMLPLEVNPKEGKSQEKEKCKNCMTYYCQLNVNDVRHNLTTVGFNLMLLRPTESVGFEQIIDFLNAYPIKYALTVNLTLYTSRVEQFWATTTVKNINGEAQLHAKVDGKKVVISKASIKRDLRFEDKGGIDCLPN